MACSRMFKRLLVYNRWQLYIPENGSLIRKPTISGRMKIKSSSLIGSFWYACYQKALLSVTCLRGDRRCFSATLTRTELSGSNGSWDKGSNKDRQGAWSGAVGQWLGQERGQGGSQSGPLVATEPPYSRTVPRDRSRLSRPIEKEAIPNSNCSHRPSLQLIGFSAHAHIGELPTYSPAPQPHPS